MFLVQGIGLPVSHALNTMAGESSTRLSGMNLTTSSATSINNCYKPLVTSSSSITLPRLPLHTFPSIDSTLLGAAQQVLYSFFSF